MARNPFVTMSGGYPIVPVVEAPNQPAMPPGRVVPYKMPLGRPLPRDEAELNLFVPGVPAPQGSKRHVGNGVMVESSKRVRPWRQDVREAALSAGVRIAGPVAVTLTFVMPRPKKPTHPTAPAGPPDLDKLIRAVLDALTSAGTFEDDARVVEMFARKVYSGSAFGDQTGVLITVRK